MGKRWNVTVVEDLGLWVRDGPEVLVSISEVLLEVVEACEESKIALETYVKSEKECAVGREVSMFGRVRKRAVGTKIRKDKLELVRQGRHKNRGLMVPVQISAVIVPQEAVYGSIHQNFVAELAYGSECLG